MSDSIITLIYNGMYIISKVCGGEVLEKYILHYNVLGGVINGLPARERYRKCEKCV